MIDFDGLEKYRYLDQLIEYIDSILFTSPNAVAYLIICRQVPYGGWT